jgi:predicted nucleic acid-binding protein
MPAYLLDTNVLLRFCDAASPQHTVAINAVATLLERDEAVYITGQYLVEFWGVTTRPLAANGFGWSMDRVEVEVDQLLAFFRFLEESPAIFTHWRQLVGTYSVQGKQVHDTRLVAVMQSYGLTHLLTFNTGDFARFSSITPTDPASV